MEENRATGQADWAQDPRIMALKPMDVPAGSVLFRPGDDAKGFVLVHSGRVAVYLTGKSGREILLYAVEPGDAISQALDHLERQYAEEGRPGYEFSIEWDRDPLQPSLIRAGLHRSVYSLALWLARSFRR